MLDVESTQRQVMAGEGLVPRDPVGWGVALDAWAFRIRETGGGERLSRCDPSGVRLEMR